MTEFSGSQLHVYLSILYFISSLLSVLLSLPMFGIMKKQDKNFLPSNIVYLC